MVWSVSSLGCVPGTQSETAPCTLVSQVVARLKPTSLSIVPGKENSLSRSYYRQQSSPVTSSFFFQKTYVTGFDDKFMRPNFFFLLQVPATEPLRSCMNNHGQATRRHDTSVI